jgi:ribonuclease BN (tRNA processing enzyme)
VWGPGRSPHVLEEILEGQMDPNFSPLQSLRNFSAKFDVRAALPSFEAEGLRITTREHAHGNTRALSFRIEENGRSFVYASDVGYPEAGPEPEAIAHYARADVLLHDSTYNPQDQATRRNRGFSSYEDACAAAIAAGAKRLVPFHYDQDYSDDAVDQIVAECRRLLDPHGIAVTPAREGDELDV